MSAKGALHILNILRARVMRVLTGERDLPVYLGRQRALMRTIWGHKMLVDTRDLSVTPHLLLDGCWERWVTDTFLARLRPGMTVVEIGANIGYYTLLAARKVGPSGRVYAFEANPEVFQILFENLSINGLLDTVAIENKAVVERPGPLQFYSLSRFHGSGSVTEFSRECLSKYHEEMRTIEVEGVSLDSYFPEQMRRIDFIRMDAEGSEPRILRGAVRLLKQNPEISILCEFDPAMLEGSGTSPKEFLRELSQWGFSINIVGHQAGVQPASIDQLLQTKHADLLLVREAKGSR